MSRWRAARLWVCTKPLGIRPPETLVVHGLGAGRFGVREPTEYRARPDAVGAIVVAREAMRVAIYARVSTGEQNPELQLRELRDYAERRGFSPGRLEPLPDRAHQP